MKVKLKSENVYIAFISLLGVLLFLDHLNPQVEDLSNWVLIYTLVGAILLLNHFNIIIPLSGNTLSMDSSIYLAGLFLFGLKIPLLALGVSSIVFLMIRFKLAWWKHLFNFANYSLMLICTYYTFILTGGAVGETDFPNIMPYALALSVYFILNVMIMWVYFYLAQKPSLKTIIRTAFQKQLIQEVFTSYLCTLVLALVLTILISQQPIFGIFLFLTLAIMLSFAFRNFFNLYKEEEAKAKRDFLTGLYNHGYFKLRLDEMLTENRKNSFCVALIDLDDFKKYNDANGHIQGDALLKFFGTFMLDKTKDLPFIAARYGGEEFGLILPGVSKQDAFTFLNKIRKEINDTYFTGVEHSPQGCISFSAGIVEYESGTYSSSELLSKADKALYFAKSQGKNAIQIYKEDHVYHQDCQFAKEIDALEQQLQIFLSKDVYTYQHSKRVFSYATEMSERLNLSSEERRTLILGALIHDIGKLEIPRDIINKKGKLDPHEWEMMKKHVIYGKEIISSIKKYDELLPLIELHHERYDGKGYPYGLRETNIPKLARILCVIDSFDAMTTERPYQKTKTFTEGIEELRACSGHQFDPTYVEPFIEMIEENYVGQGDSPLVPANPNQEQG
ncbi:bifunctional diguanylate cyclase/phosphohydrolase [Rossellomorea sp. NPDC071047]|uniref:bifunctional diguanylate cyclase/phosphohydrolase n=1 Tax=Rossellomorea sp. NPDC071047 TaxID=3390675 RepID=UPI003CFF2C41